MAEFYNFLKRLDKVFDVPKYFDINPLIKRLKEEEENEKEEQWFLFYSEYGYGKERAMKRYLEYKEKQNERNHRKQHYPD